MPDRTGPDRARPDRTGPDRTGGDLDNRIHGYFTTLAGLASGAAASGAGGEVLALGEAFSRVIALTAATAATGHRLMFVGNGGSAGIASHMAIDYSKNGGMPATAFNDGAALTCLGNDYGYEHVFAKQIEFHARSGDALIAISSSGRSVNILNAVAAARRTGCAVVTLSGFTADNPLRRSGDVNFYVASGEYGFVEVAHLALIHAWLDLAMADRASAAQI
jgi:D-sedoheptulose 7-phosphate isomerase